MAVDKPAIKISLLDLPDEVLAEIGPHLVEPPPAYPSHYEEAPTFACRGVTHNIDPEPNAYTDKQRTRDLRAFRAACRRLRNAVALTGLHVDIPTHAALGRWSTSKLAESVTRLRVRVPLEAVWYSECPRGQCTYLGRCGGPACKPVNISRYLERLGLCLKGMRNLTELSIASLPSAGNHSDYHWDPGCASVAPTIDGFELPPEIRLDKLQVLEISSADVGECHICTAAMVNWLRRFVPQCEVVKLGAVPRNDFRPPLNDIAVAVSHTLFLRTQDTASDNDYSYRNPILNSLSAPYFADHTRRLFIHECGQFVYVRLPNFTPGLDAPAFVVDDGGSSAISLLDKIRPWRNLEELDLRLFTGRRPQEMPTMRCGTSVLSMESVIRDPRRHRIRRVAACPEVELTQRVVATAIATELPKLRKIWSWDQARTPEPPYKCGIDLSIWNMLIAFRMAWTIERIDGTISLQRLAEAEIFTDIGVAETVSMPIDSGRDRIHRLP